MIARLRRLERRMRREGDHASWLAGAKDAVERHIRDTGERLLAYGREQQSARLAHSAA